MQLRVRDISNVKRKIVKYLSLDTIRDERERLRNNLPLSIRFVESKKRIIWFNCLYM